MARRSRKEILSDKIQSLKNDIAEQTMRLQQLNTQLEENEKELADILGRERKAAEDAMFQRIAKTIKEKDMSLEEVEQIFIDIIAKK